MKRWLMRTCVFLPLGALVNVAVAWGCLFFEGARGTDSPHRPFGITRDYDGVLMAGFPMRSFHWPKYYAHLPDSMIWPGFAINTLFHAGVLWMLFCGPFALRRMIRRRRGQCPACAYPTWGGGQSPVCTECGAPRPRAVTRSSVTHEGQIRDNSCLFRLGLMA